MKRTLKNGLIEGVGFWSTSFDNEKEFNKITEDLDFHKILTIIWDGHKILAKDLRTPFPKTTICANACAPSYVINYINKNIEILDLANID